MQKPDSLYRIGLFGRSNAGKTSLLVALSETTSATVDGQVWTIQYLPPVEGSIDDQGLFDKLKRGQKLLQEAKQSILKMDKPPASNESENTTLYRFQIASGGSVRIVELCDYAGEILTPSRLNTVESHGHVLAKRIAECDAVFVLAPASDQSDESKVDQERSEQVAKSIARLHSWIQQHDPRQQTHKRPFGLLVTKVDRLGQTGDFSMSDCGAPANLVWDKVQSLYAASFTKWFGLIMLPQTGTTTKAVSTGLIGPLVWAMDAADNEVVRVARQDDQLSLLRSPIGFRRSKAFGLGQVTGLLHRRPAMTEHTDSIHDQARGIQKSLRRSLRLFAATIFLGLLLVVLIALSAVDSIQSGGFRRVAEDPDSKNAELLDARNYFASYDERTLWMFPFGPSSDEAKGLRDLCRNHIAEEKWFEVEKEIDPVKKGELADDYRGQQHRDEAKALVAAGKTEQDRRRIDEERRRYVAWFDPYLFKSKQEISIKERAELLNSIAAVPPELNETQPQADQRIAILGCLEKEQAIAIEKADREVIVQQIENLVQRQRPLEALGAISVRPESLDWVEMKSTLTLLKANWASDIDSQLSGFKKNEQFEAAIQTLQKAVQDRNQIPVLANFPSTPDLGVLLLGVKSDWDKADYANFKRRPSTDTANKYLVAAHSKCMQQTVTKWKIWKETENSRQALRPHLDAITWAKETGADDPVVDFYVNGQQILNKHPAGGGGYGATYGFPTGTASLEFLPNDAVEIRIVLWDDDSYLTGGDDPVAEFEGTFKFSDLTSAKGAVHTLPTDDKKAIHRFRVRLIGMPAAPELLEWQSCP